MPIRYFCSDGRRISQSMILVLYKKARFKKYGNGGQSLPCEGCGAPATGSAHIIAQSRCKTLHKTELIWDVNNFFPACISCNSAIENPKGQEWKKLRNVDKCIKFVEENDPELFAKFMANNLEGNAI